jgi:membrane fusion protein (multidrug efflux system)
MTTKFKRAQGQVATADETDESGRFNHSGSPSNEKPPPELPRKKRRLLVPIVILLIAIAGISTWWLVTRNYEDTDDAQVDGHLNPISSRVSGTILAVHVEDNQRVQAGQALIELDPKDYQVDEAQSRADYDEALADTTAERPNLPITITGNTTDEATGRAQVTNADAALAAAQHDYDNALARLRSSEATDVRAQSDLQRYTELVRKQEVAQSDYDQFVATAKAQNATVEADKAAVLSASKTIEQHRALVLEQQSKLDQTLKNATKQISIRQATIQSREAVAESSSAKLDRARLNLAYTRIVCPVNGIVTERSAEVGARISQGQQLMMVVQTDDLWVTANFKETQLHRMHAGQGVRIHVDALGDDFDGYIENMPAATGDRTSVLPPENATGNYVKVLQRLPVRIRFKHGQRDLDKLRPGMSVEPKVHLD